MQATLSFPDMPELGQGWEMLLPAAERSRRCTGSSAVLLEEKRVAIVQACVHLGTRRVAQAFDVSREVVRALRAEAIRTGELDQFKEEEGRRTFAVADRLLDRLEDEVDLLPRASLPIAYGILLDKGMSLTGAPVAVFRHDVVHTVADVASYIASLPAAQPVSEQETNGQKDRPAAAAGSALAPIADANRDSQSLVSLLPSEREPAISPDSRRESTLETPAG